MSLLDFLSYRYIYALGPLFVIFDIITGITTVEPRLTTTLFIRPPRYYSHILSNQT